MPITQGGGNPDWTRDETLLALDLLYRHGKPIDRHHRDVIDLSDILRRSTIHPSEKRRPNFRNPDGVALKLQNLLSAIEPGRGLSFSNGDREAAKEFPQDRSNELSKIAQAIRIALADQTGGSKIGAAAEKGDADEVFAEGWALTARHKFRDRRLRKKLLALKDDNSLRCEICEFSPPSLDRSLQESFFEAHHRTPLAEAESRKLTRVSDMALLCAGCHRFIHKLIATERRWISVRAAADILKACGT